MLLAKSRVFSPGQSPCTINARQAAVTGESIFRTISGPQKATCMHSQANFGIRYMAHTKAIYVRRENRELKHALFEDADGNRKGTFCFPRQWCLPDFYTNHL